MLAQPDRAVNDPGPRPDNDGENVSHAGVGRLPTVPGFPKRCRKLHAQGQCWTGEAFGWPAEYHPESPEPPLESRMAFTPADFCIGQSGVWFFSLMWEHGRDVPPVEFLDDRNILV